METIKCTNCGAIMTPSESDNIFRCPDCLTMYNPSEKMSVSFTILDLGKLGKPNVKVVKRNGK
jgi:DNA-directed RNA polymerase subunit M/transcription elongation factor TFIIS